MPAKYDKAPQDVLDLLQEARERYHSPRIDTVKIGVIIALAETNEKGDPAGPALTYKGVPAAAKIIKVSARDRIAKGYEAELIIDGDMWGKWPVETKIALLDHELTHIEPTGETDDNGRPKIKLREEDFMVWGFIEVAARHGRAALEAQAFQRVYDDHGQQLLCIENNTEE